MSKRKTPAQALEEFLSYYDESILEYRYACDKVVEEDKRLQDFLHEMEFAKDRNERNRIATSLQQSRRTRRINNHIIHTACPRILVLSDTLFPFFCNTTAPLLCMHILYSLAVFRSSELDTGVHILANIFG